MSTRTQIIVSFVVKFLMDQFKQGLKVHNLLQHMNEFNTFMTQMMTYELVYAAEFPAPNKKTAEIQEKFPMNIEPDHNANFRLQEISVPHEETHQLEHQISNQQRIYKRVKKESTSIVPQPDKGVFALSEPSPPTPAQCQLEQQIGQIKKRLNFMRRLKRQNQQEQRRRYEQLQNRKHLQLPGKQFAYDFSGEFLFKKKMNFKKNILIVPNGKSQEINDIMNKQKNKQSQQESERDMLVSRGQGGSREGKRILFGNSGKRQVSNLPFIKLGQHVKFTQNHRSASGPDTSRYTLKSYHSRGESTFKSFAQIQKQRTQRIYSLKRSSKFSQLTQDEPQEKSATTHVQIRKQSKKMQKYLKKLTQDRSKDFVMQLNKSSNFHRLNSPHDYSVHRYYRHNFDDDKKSICDSSLVSLRLNNSHFKQLKYE